MADPQVPGRFVARASWQAASVAIRRPQHAEPLGQWIDRAPENQRAVTGAEAADVVWALAGPETYEQLVLDRGWTPDRYARWLARALVNVVFGTAP